ncbi:accessory regulator AgrB [Sinorhizobium medicae]|nr:accessory regulator AgrB [Sinorhizobium medicae]
MIDSSAKKLSIYIKSKVPEHPSSVEVLEYSIGMFLNIAAIILGSLIISIMTGNTVEVLIILFSFSLLRQFSGGIHLKSGTSCAIASISLFTVLSFFHTNQDLYVNALTCISLVFVFLYAPSNFEKQYNIPKKYYPILKLVSLVIVMSNFIFISDALAISFFVQSLTLIIGKEVKRYGRSNEA